MHVSVDEFRVLFVQTHSRVTVSSSSLRLDAHTVFQLLMTNVDLLLLFFQLLIDDATFVAATAVVADFHCSTAVFAWRSV